MVVVVGFAIHVGKNQEIAASQNKIHGNQKVAKQ